MLLMLAAPLDLVKAASLLGSLMIKDVGFDLSGLLSRLPHGSKSLPILSSHTLPVSAVAYELPPRPPPPLQLARPPLPACSCSGHACLSTAGPIPARFIMHRLCPRPNLGSSRGVVSSSVPPDINPLGGQLGGLSLCYRHGPRRGTHPCMLVPPPPSDTRLPLLFAVILVFGFSSLEPSTDHGKPVVFGQPDLLIQ